MSAQGVGLYGWAVSGAWSKSNVGRAISNGYETEYPLVEAFRPRYKPQSTEEVSVAGC